MLDYSIPQFTFLIGNFDATDYLDSIALFLPLHEPNQLLLWSGRFVVSFNLKAKENGLTENDFSEWETPDRWRPYQQPIRLLIKGYQSPVFRIEDYRYNPQNNSGEGRLTQILQAVLGDRPSIDQSQGGISFVSGGIGGNSIALGGIGTSPSVPQIYGGGGDLNQVVEKLLTESFNRSSFNPSINLSGITGWMNAPVVTRNPIDDAQRLCGINWQFLSIDTSESIVTINGNASSKTSLFSRNINQFEYQPDLDGQWLDCQKVIVTGAYQYPDSTGCENDPPFEEPNPNLDEKGRTRIQETTEERPIGLVFPQLGSSTTPITYENKRIGYQYWDENSIPSGLNLPAEVIFESQRQSLWVQPIDNQIPVQTITIKRQPFGVLFPSEGTNSTLVPAEVIIESDKRKVIYKPSGVLFPQLGTSTTLQVERYEVLETESIPRGKEPTPVAKDPKTGKAQCYEKRPELEPLQPIAEQPLQTAIVRGEYNLAPLGYTPINNKPLVIDFGFVPSTNHASYLAQMIGLRESYRRNQALIIMPIPDEWLSGGWQPLSICELGGDIYLMDGIALEMNGSQAKFSFTGGLIRYQGFASSIGIFDSFQPISLKSAWEYTIAFGVGGTIKSNAIWSTLNYREIIADFKLTNSWQSIAPIFIQYPITTSANWLEISPETVIPSIKNKSEWITYTPPTSKSSIKPKSQWLEYPPELIQPPINLANNWEIYIPSESIANISINSQWAESSPELIQPSINTQSQWSIDADSLFVSRVKLSTEWDYVILGDIDFTALWQYEIKILSNNSLQWDTATGYLTGYPPILSILWDNIQGSDRLITALQWDSIEKINILNP